MRKVKVTLNGQEYEIKELRSRANAVWRQSLRKPFDELAEALETGLDIELTDASGIGSIIAKAADLIVGSIDKLIILLLEYAPELEEAAKEAYDSELIEAFSAVLSLAYPFGAVLRYIKAARPKATPPKPADPTPAKA